MDYKKKYLEQKDFSSDIITEMSLQIKVLEKELKYYKENDSKLKKIASDFKNKLLLVVFLIKKIPIDCECIIPSLSGSLVRQLFEYALSGGALGKSYANPLGRDVDIILSNIALRTHHIQCVTQTFDKFISLIKEEHLQWEYSLKKISSVTVEYGTFSGPPGKMSLVGIPHYKLSFIEQVNPENVIDIDIIGWKPAVALGWNNIDFDVNSLYINENNMGIIEGNGNLENIFMWDIISQIENRQCDNLIDLEQIHLLAQESPGKFKTYMMQLIYFLAERLKIIEAGYTVKSNTMIPTMRIERNEICSYSSCKPPYPMLLLKCNHWISVQTLALLLQNNTKICIECSEHIILSFSDDNTFPIEPNEEFISTHVKKTIKKIMAGHKFI